MRSLKTSRSSLRSWSLCSWGWLLSLTCMSLCPRNVSREELEPSAGRCLEWGHFSVPRQADWSEGRQDHGATLMPSTGIGAKQGCVGGQGRDARFEQGLLWLGRRVTDRCLDCTSRLGRVWQCRARTLSKARQLCARPAPARAAGLSRAVPSGVVPGRAMPGPWGYVGQGCASQTPLKRVHVQARRPDAGPERLRPVSCCRRVPVAVPVPTPWPWLRSGSRAWHPGVPPPGPPCPSPRAPVSLSEADAFAAPSLLLLLLRSSLRAALQTPGGACPAQPQPSPAPPAAVPARPGPAEGGSGHPPAGAPAGPSGLPGSPRGARRGLGAPLSPGRMLPSSRTQLGLFFILLCPANIIGLWW